jgi:hypothetical protein
MHGWSRVEAKSRLIEGLVHTGKFTVPLGVHISMVSAEHARTGLGVMFILAWTAENTRLAIVSIKSW